VRSRPDCVDPITRPDLIETLVVARAIMHHGRDQQGLAFDDLHCISRVLADLSAETKMTSPFGFANGRRRRLT
jgi:hypothetical protein